MPGNTSLDFSFFIADRTHDFAGREWVFEEVNGWWADPEGERILLLTGGTGTDVRNASN